MSCAGRWVHAADRSRPGGLSLSGRSRPTVFRARGPAPARRLVLDSRPKATRRTTEKLACAWGRLGGLPGVLVQRSGESPVVAVPGRTHSSRPYGNYRRRQLSGPIPLESRPCSRISLRRQPPRRDPDLGLRTPRLDRRRTTTPVARVGIGPDGFRRRTARNPLANRGVRGGRAGSLLSGNHNAGMVGVGRRRRRLSR